MRFLQELTDEIDDLFDLLGTHLHIVSSQDFNHLHRNDNFLFYYISLLVPVQRTWNPDI